MSSWYLNNDNEIVQDDFPEPINYLTPPYPASMWRLDSDNDLVTLLFPEALANFTPPYPASMWYLDEDDELMNGMLPDVLPLGAFANNPNLTEVVLPSTLSSIGRESFAGTGLTAVTIPNDNCTYYSTSFPENCTVTGGQIIT